MTARRPARVDEQFSEFLDGHFGTERGPNGEPSVTDFLLVDLPPIVELFANRFDDLATLFPDRPNYRHALVVGYLVPRLLVTGHLDADGSIILMSVRFDLDADW